MGLFGLLLILLVGIAFIVVATARWHLHPFIALIVAAYAIGAASGVPLLELSGIIKNGSVPDKKLIIERPIAVLALHRAIVQPMV